MAVGFFLIGFGLLLLVLAAASAMGNAVTTDVRPLLLIAGVLAAAGMIVVCWHGAFYLLKIGGAS